MKNLDWNFISKYAPLYVEAAKLTVFIAFWGILLAFAVGVLCSAALYYRVPVLRRVIAVYIELSRNTPLLVQLFFLYFGLPNIVVEPTARQTSSRKSTTMVDVADAVAITSSEAKAERAVAHAANWREIKRVLMTCPLFSARFHEFRP